MGDSLVDDATTSERFTTALKSHLRQVFMTSSGDWAVERKTENFHLCGTFDKKHLWLTLGKVFPSSDIPTLSTSRLETEGEIQIIQSNRHYPILEVKKSEGIHQYNLSLFSSSALRLNSTFPAELFFV